MAYPNEVNLFFPNFDRNTVPVFNDAPVIIPAHTAVTVSGMYQQESSW